MSGNGKNVHRVSRRTSSLDLTANRCAPKCGAGHRLIVAALSNACRRQMLNRSLRQLSVAQTHSPLAMLTLFVISVSYTHLRAHETGRNLVCRLLLEKKKKK